MLRKSDVMGKSEQTENRIIDSFFNLAGRNQKITVATLCKKANITPPTFYSHFRSIDALVIAIRERTDDAIFAVMEKHTPTQNSASFEIIADEILPLVYKNRVRLRILYTSGIDFEWWGFLEQRYMDWIKPYYEGAGEQYGISDEFLLRYMAKSMITMISLWISEPIPDKPKIFKEKFLLLIETPLIQFVRKQQEKL